MGSIHDSLRRHRNIEDNDQVARIQGFDIDASTALWQHDKAWIRVPARLARAAWQSNVLSGLTFFASHYAYFIIVCLASSLIFWGSSDPSRSIAYVDSLFLVVSAMTAAGLRTINLSQATTGQQVLLSLLIISGSRIWVSLWVVYSRIRRFDKRFKSLVGDARASRRPRLSPGSHQSLPSLQSFDSSPSTPTTSHLGPSRATSGLDMTSPNPDPEAPETAESREDDPDPLPYLSWNNETPRLTSEQRDELGGIEYRALKLLLLVLLLYFFLWQLLGCIALGAWINDNLPGSALDNGVKPWWVGVFNGISAFHNSGMSLLDASMVPFQRSYFVLVTQGLMILAGYTAFPLLLRSFIWSMLKLTPMGSGIWECLRFISDHPRRVYTHLWSRTSTLWLLFVLTALTSVNWVGFVLFGLDNADVKSIPTGPRALDGLFQALCIRFGGFYVTKISSLHVGLQLLYLITMFIPTSPFKASIRRTNVYEERPLAIYRVNEDGDSAKLNNQIRSIPLRILQHVVRHDTWLLPLAVFVITTIEAGSFQRDPIDYSVFNIIFEVASAYCCVGISVGLPNVDYSFSGGWHASSKVILCVVMMRGRHRGLPDAIDQAILLPSEHLRSRVEGSGDRRGSFPSSRWSGGSFPQGTGRV